MEGLLSASVTQNIVLRPTGPKLKIGAQGISLFLVTQHLGGLESKLLMGFST